MGHASFRCHLAFPGMLQAQMLVSQKVVRSKTSCCNNADSWDHPKPSESEQSLKIHLVTISLGAVYMQESLTVID